MLNIFELSSIQFAKGKIENNKKWRISRNFETEKMCEKCFVQCVNEICGNLNAQRIIGISESFRGNLLHLNKKLFYDSDR